MFSILKRLRRPVAEPQPVAVPSPVSEYTTALFAEVLRLSGNCSRVPREATGDPLKDASLLYSAATGEVMPEWRRNGLEDQVASLKTQLADMKDERDHWKANHDNQVAIKRALLDRPDLAERAKAVQSLVDERDALRADGRMYPQQEDGGFSQPVTIQRDATGCVMTPPQTEAFEEDFSDPYYDCGTTEPAPAAPAWAGVVDMVDSDKPLSVSTAEFARDEIARLQAENDRLKSAPAAPVVSGAESSEPITTQVLEDRQFAFTAIAAGGSRFWVRYIFEFHAIACRHEPLNDRWQWQLEEHRDDMNWDDKFVSLPRSCQPQTVEELDRLIDVLSGQMVRPVSAGT